MTRTLCLATTMLTTLAFAGPASAEAPKVVASIKPVHSLVAAVMEGIGEPTLIVKGDGSPHTWSLRPSEAAAIEAADVVFWVGGTLEPFLERPIQTLGERARVVELSSAHDLVTLSYREGGPFEAHSHDHDHDHAHEAAEADHDHDHDHGHDAAEVDHDHDHDHAHDAAEADHDHDHDHAHDAADAGHDQAHEHGAIDMHIWLDPHNARAMVHEIEETLVAIDPANRERYEQNAEAVTARLQALETEVVELLEPVKDRGFIVFHDAYQYFENRFGIAASGSITVSPEVAPGAQRVAEIRDRVRSLGAACVFAEPQFEPRIVQTVTEGTEARPGVLDPLGAELEDGPELYFTLVRNLAESLANCLSGES